MNIITYELKYIDFIYLKQYKEWIFDKLAYPEEVPIEDITNETDFENLKSQYFQKMLKIELEDNYNLYVNMVHGLFYFIIIDTKNKLIISDEHPIDKFWNDYLDSIANLENKMDFEIFKEGIHLVGNINSKYLGYLLEKKDIKKIRDLLLEKYRNCALDTCCENNINENNKKIARLQNDLYVSYSSSYEFYYKIIKNDKLFSSFLTSLVYDFNINEEIDYLVHNSSLNNKHFCKEKNISIL